MFLEKIKTYLLVLLGIFIVATAFNIFFLSSNLAAYGISGLSIITKDKFGWDPSIFILISNIILIIISFIFLGKDYTKKTIVGAILFPLFIKLTAFLPEVININGTEIVAIALVGGTISGIGSGLIYKYNFGTAGTDITNQLLVKYLKMPMGKAIAIGDGIVVLLGGLVFGFEKMIFALITLFTMSYVCNKIMIGSNKTKTFFIVTKKVEKVRDYITETLKNDVSLFKGKGGYKCQEKSVLVSTIETKKYYELKEGIKYLDKDAFVVTTNSYEAINKKKIK